MKRIIITAILTVICAVGAGTSFAVNDLPNFGEWMKTNEQQFKKPPKVDNQDKHIDKHIKDGKEKHDRKDGRDLPNDQNMPQNGQPVQPNGQMPAPAQNGQMAPQGQPMPPQGQAPQQPNGNASQQAPNGGQQGQ